MQNRPTGRSRKRTRRKKGGCGPALLAGFIFLAAGCGAGFLYGKYLKPGTVMADKRDVFQIKGNQVALILDNELQEANGIYEDGQVYLPVDWVDDYVNQRFYWDDGEKLLVYALPEEIVYADESTEGEAGPLLKEKDGETYLSLGLVKNYTDIREEAFATSEIKRVFIDTDWDTYETATLRHKTALRIKGGIRSEIINTEEKGTSVQILEQMDKWSKVRTEDGYMGYVPNSRLSKVEEETPVSEFNAPVYTNISMDGKVRLGFHQVTTKDANATFDKVADTAQGMNVIVPTWFNITDNEGNYTSLASKDYVDKAHALGIQVWAMFDNISTEESVKNVDSGKLFSSTATRKKLIENLMKEADTYGFDGFNLDFESLKSSAGPHYVQFIREMSVSCRQKGLVLSVDDYVPAVYSAFYNRKEQGIVADYVIVMGYDEHFAGGDAGSVASISYVENGITGTLKEVPKEKLINSVPFYTRVWTEKDGKTTSKAYGMTAAKKWVDENNVELTWQDKVGQYYGEIENENGIQVVVIPGNHDINNRNAASFDGRSRQMAEAVSANEFAEIYNDFGYDEALSRDPASLSYTYDLGPDMRLLMLDSCQYSPTNKVGGMIKTETYDWIDDQLDEAWDDGVILLPVAHHNLLDESKIYVEDCTIEHSEELVNRLEEENVPLFLSGHLHVQHYMRNEEDRGIYEIVTSSLSTPPCQYGVLEYRDDESFSYHTQQVDMEKWARKHKSTDENLLNFNTYAPAALRTIFYNQSYDAMKDSEEEETGDLFVKLTQRQKEQMSEVYAQLNAACYGGKAYEVVKEATTTPAYKMWQEYCYPMVLFEYLEYIVDDAVKDYNYLEVN